MVVARVDGSVGSAQGIARIWMGDENGGWNAPESRHVIVETAVN